MEIPTLYSLEMKREMMKVGGRGRDDVARASEGMPLSIVDDVIALRAAAKSKG